MAKKPPAEASEAARKRRPQKKTTASKAGARKPSKPARKPSKPAGDAPGRAAPVEFASEDVGDVIEDADIIAESPAETTLVSASSGRDAAQGAGAAVEVIEVDDQPPTLSPEEQE